MSAPPFAHLHCHSHYSLLDGAGKISGLLKRTKELGMNSLALTDHGNLHGALEFYKAAKEMGINPIVGIEAYIAPSSRFYKENASGSKEASYHITILAKDRTGFQNLLKLSSRAFLEGFYFRPRIDKELLAAHSEGLVCLSGCVSSELNRGLLMGGTAGMEKAREAAAWYHEVFRDRYFIEIQYNGVEQQRIAMEGAIDLANRMGLPLVATSDVHYVLREDAEAQDILLCVNTGKFRTDTNRMRMETNEFYLRSPEEMYTVFSGYHEALKRSQEIADGVHIDLELGKRHFPVYSPPDAKTSEDYLRELVLAGLQDRYAGNPLRIGTLSGAPSTLGPGHGQLSADNPQRAVESELSADNPQRAVKIELSADNPQRAVKIELSAEVMARVDRELGVIDKLGFANYFLIVWDFVRFARSRDIPATARGSGVGSLVAYGLYLSHVCPLDYDLLFERFLDENRREAPDIDIDFCQQRRGEVIQYVKEKYGMENVAQIGTFGTLAARAAIRDVGRALGMTIPRVDAVVAMVPDELKITIRSALEKSGDLKKLHDNDAEIRELLTLAMKIEGLARNVGTHAAAVVIADRPLTDYVPVQRVQNKEEIITQWAMGDVEKAGLLKMDFLGLRNLTILSKVIGLIEQTTGRQVDPYKFPLDDRETFALLCRGETKGVFQLESGGIRDLLQRMKPDHFRDIIATNALYRPGPLEGGMVEDYIQVKHGRKQAHYEHAVMEEVLAETHGVMVYQEQVMRILNRLGGIALANAYSCIKAISKKKLETIAKFREEFIEGAFQNGMAKKKAEEVFNLIEKFAGYGFNKCVVGATSIIEADTGRRTTVGELFQNRREFRIHSLGEDGKLRARRVTGVVGNGRKRVHELTTVLGKRITATANHPLRTLDGWKLLGELKPGDRIAAPRKLRVPRGGRWPRHEIAALAYLLSEGNTCHPTCLYFYNNDRLLIDDFVAVAEQFPRSVARIDHRAQGGRMEVCVSTGEDMRFCPGQRPWNAGANGGTALAAPPRVRCGMYRWAEKQGLIGKRATEKAMPVEVFALRDADLELLLGRLWSGDGSLGGPGQMPYYATSSRQLALDVQTLLLRLGIVSRLRATQFAYKYKGRESKRLGYTVHLVGADSTRAFLDRVIPQVIGRAEQIEQIRAHLSQITPGLTSKDTVPAEVRAWVDEERRQAGLAWRDLERESGVSMKEFVGRGSAAKRGFRRATIARLAAFFNSLRLRQAAESDVYWDTVKSIEPRGVQETYDLTVEEDHNFVADGLIVHNSHSTAYALIAYMTAYLKAHFKVEFMAALLSSDIPGRNFKKKDSLVEHVEDCQRMTIEVMPPDVNRSDVEFAVGDGKIFYALSAIKGCGGAAAAAIVKARDPQAGASSGPYRSLFDFCQRLDPSQVNRTAIESLVKAGAFDSLGGRRSQWFAAVDRGLQAGASAAADRRSGQKGLFDDEEEETPATTAKDLPDLPEWEQKDRLAKEKEVLGFYLSSHPLAEHAKTLHAYCSHTTVEAAGVKNRDKVMIGGMIASIKHSHTKNPKPGSPSRYAMFDLEDTEGIMRCTCWPEQFAQFGELIQSEVICVLGGAIDKRPGSEEANLIVNEIIPFGDLEARYTRGIRVTLNEETHGVKKLEMLYEILRGYPGAVPLELSLALADGRRVRCPCDKLRIANNAEMRGRVEELLGNENFRLITARPGGGNGRGR